MEIGNGIDRRKPLNAHVNLHRLLFYILHILGEICTARKSFTSLVGTVGQLSLSTMNVFTTFVKQKGEKWYGKISKWRFFYPLFLLQIWPVFTHAAVQAESQNILLFLFVSLQIAIRAGCVCPCRTLAGEPTCLSCVSHLLSQRIPDLQM